MDLSPEDRANLGPLARLVGTWAGDKGNDFAPAPDRGPSTNLFHEQSTFVSIGRVDNHEQILYGVRYSTMAWRIGEPNPFHEDLGYWLWEPVHHRIMRGFVVPRGISVLAGGVADPNATSFEVHARLGSPVFGILSNPFLDAEFKTVAFDLTITIDGELLSYAADTVMEMKGRAELFHHTDRNTLRRTAP